MEVTKKVSESMNMFSGNSSGKNNLVKLVLDDTHMIYSTAAEKVIQLLSIKRKPCKGRGKWTEEERKSHLISNKWEEQFAELEAHDRMPT